MAIAATAATDANRPMTGSEKTVIVASSVGTVFEWYDFYLYGWTAAQIGKAFYSAFDANTQFIFALLTFSAGFVVRPIGALVFGRFGDMIGRKYTFLVTITIMGLSTFLVGLTPDYAVLGWGAPAILITLRLLQGLALGGEYGGAAIYVAEHSPQGRRGYFTSWIQTTATVGLFLSLLVVLIVRNSVSPATFTDPSFQQPIVTWCPFLDSKNARVSECDSMPPHPHDFPILTFSRRILMPFVLCGPHSVSEVYRRRKGDPY